MEDEYDDDGDALAQYFKDYARHPEAVNPPLRKYEEDELPWDMKVAYPHPTLEGIIIVSSADMPHAERSKSMLLSIVGS